MSRKKLITLIVSVVFSITAGFTALIAGTATKIIGPDSEDSLRDNYGERLAALKGIPARDTFFAILSSAKLTVEGQEFVEARESLYELLSRQVDHNGNKLFASVKTLNHSLLEKDFFVTKDAHHLLLIAESQSPVYKTVDSFKELPASLEAWLKLYPSLTLQYTSAGILTNEIFTLVNNDLDKSLKYTIPITIVILLWAFRTVAAALVAMIITGLSLLSSLGIAAILSHLIEPISITAAQLIVLIVMAVGTDYALFYLRRVLDEKASGKSYSESIAACRQTSARAILWSGIIVAISLTGLLLAHDPILSSMAIVSVISVITTLYYSLVVLPIIIILLGSLIESGNLRKYSNSGSAALSSLILKSTNNPKTALFSGIFALLSISSFCCSIKLGSTMQDTLLPPRMRSSAALHNLHLFYPDIAGTDLSIILSSQKLAELEADDKFQPFLDKLQEDENVRGPVSVEWSPDGTLARYRYSVKGTSDTEANKALVNKLANEYIPNLLLPEGIEGYLSGKLVYEVRQQAAYRQKTLLVISSILGASFLFLLFVFESLVISLKAMLLNIVSVGAAFGFLVLTFQLYGWKYGIIECFVPCLLFSILFGLSMDYHLILISSIRDEVRRGVPTRTAVETGLANNYGVVSSAAIIMASVFIVISFLDLPLMRQLGAGLAFAVIIDATLIRCCMLPASIVLLGDLNWYMPDYLIKPIRYLKSLRLPRNRKC